MFEDVHGVEVVVHDLLICGKTKEQHDERLTKVFQRAIVQNLKLNVSLDSMKSVILVTYLAKIA